MRKVFISLIFIMSFLISIPNVKAANGWGFNRNNNHTTPDIGRYKEEIEGTSSYYIGDSTKKDIYLTFDAGYDNGTLPLILDVLKEKNVKVTVFVTGDFLKRERDLVERIANEGHIVGNHTYNHKDITKLSVEQLEKEIKHVEDEYFKITNKDMIKLFRPPEGSFDKKSLKNVQNLGYKTFFWSIAYKDWDTKNQNGKEYVYNHIMDNIHNGAIILMHSVSKDNLEALPMVIDSIRNEGYTFKNLDSI